MRPTSEAWIPATGALTGKIAGELNFSREDANILAPCGPSIGEFHTGILLNGIPAGLDGFVDNVEAVPGVPPSFFAGPNSALNRVASVTDEVKIARTGVFTPVGMFVPINRYFVGSDSLFAWLQSQPYDSAMGSPADIKVHLELVRVSDSAVVWRGDTVSARAVGDSTADRFVTIPLSSLMPGTEVFIRLKSTITAGLIYDFSAGFRFDDDTTSVPPAAKHTIQQGSIKGASEKKEALSLSFAPNPTQGAGLLEATVRVPGHVEFELYDARGTRVATLPSLEVEQPDTYRLQFDSNTLPNGAYMIVATINGERTTIRIQVAR